MECVLRTFGSYEHFEEVTGGRVLPKCQVWAAVRKYLQKEGCVGEVREAANVHTHTFTCTMNILISSHKTVVIVSLTM